MLSNIVSKYWSANKFRIRGEKKELADHINKKEQEKGFAGPKVPTSHTASLGDLNRPIKVDGLLTIVNFLSEDEHYPGDFETDFQREWDNRKATFGEIPKKDDPPEKLPPETKPAKPLTLEEHTQPPTKPRPPKKAFLLRRWPVAAALTASVAVIAFTFLATDRFQTQWHGNAPEASTDVPAENGEREFLEARKAAWTLHTQKRVSLLTTASAKGHVVAKAELAFLHYTGNGTPIDKDLGLSYFKAAREGLLREADEKDLYAMYFLALLKKNGIGFEKDTKKAEELWREAFARGMTAAAYQIGNLLLFGDQESRYCEAMWFTKIAADAGYYSAKLNYAEALYRDRCTTAIENPDVVAYKIVEQLAQQGVPHAQSGLAFIYENGWGTSVGNQADRDNLAVKWYEKAVDQNYPLAATRLAWMLTEGRGIPDLSQDARDEKALSLFQKAALESNSPEGRYGWAWMRLHNRGFDSNDQQASDEKAVELLQYAAEYHDYPRAIHTYAWMLEKGRGTEEKDQRVNDREAVNWYKLNAEKHDNPASQNNLAVMFQQGRGVVQDHDEALKWFNKSAEKNNLYGIRNLARYKAGDFGTEWENVTESIALFDRASKLGNAYASRRAAEFYLSRIVTYHQFTGLRRNIIDIYNGILSGMAAPYLQTGFTQGDQTSAYLLAAVEYSFDEGFHGIDRTVAKEALQFAASNEISCAYNLTGAAYETGYFGDVDLNEALRWYRKASDAEITTGTLNYVRLDRLMKKKLSSDAVRLLEWEARNNNQVAICAMAHATLYDPDHRDTVAAARWLYDLRSSGTLNKDQTDRLMMPSSPVGPDDEMWPLYCKPLEYYGHSPAIFGEFEDRKGFDLYCD